MSNIKKRYISNIIIIIFLITGFFCGYLCFNKYPQNLHNTKYLYVEDIMDRLNSLNNKELTLLKEFDIVCDGAMPLYKIEREYSDSLAFKDGRIAAISKYIEGTYKISDENNVVIRIIQDKTKENNGYICGFQSENIENTNKQILVYKYRDSFLTFMFTSKENKPITNEADNFIKIFFNIYKSFYKVNKK